LTFNRLIALFLLLLASAWVALVNGQPLFMTDTSAYVRGPDFAAVYFFGNQVATSWTQERTLQRTEQPSRQANSDSPVHDMSLNAPYDKAVLSGRSIFYGALLYIGHLTSQLWLSVFAQAAIFLYLSNTLALKCLRLSFLTFVGVTSAILIITPVSFFISLLMPDVFASFLIVAMIILAGFWDVLKPRDRIIVSSIILYSALNHTSHLILLVILSAVFAGTCFIAERKMISFRSFSKRAAVLIALIVIGFVGELAFSYGTYYMIGADPVRPPFVMARVIADGPGYQFLQKNCATKRYIVCNYIDRLPAHALTFLWSTDPKIGVFSVADLATRTALSKEQGSFVFDVLRSDPFALMSSAAKNFVRQLTMVRLNEIFPDQNQLDAFRAKLPQTYFDGMLRSHVIFHDWVLALANAWYFSIYILSALGLLTCAIWLFGKCHKRSDTFPTQQWVHVLTISVAAIVVNAAICGVLSEPTGRYQARISWIPLFIIFLIIGRLWEARSPTPNESELLRGLAEQLPRPLRFLGVGGIGLLTDIGTFTIIAAFGPHALIARLGSLAIATLVTWRLNRELTFDRSGRHQHDEALRYATVTIVAQGTSYAIFAALVLTVLAAMPQVAIVIGAAGGALLSYKGHHLLSFAPKVVHSHS
jgi:putative flippase GtrA